MGCRERGNDLSVSRYARATSPGQQSRYSAKRKRDQPGLASIGMRPALPPLALRAVAAVRERGGKAAAWEIFVGTPFMASVLA